MKPGKTNVVNLKTGRRVDLVAPNACIPLVSPSMLYTVTLSPTLELDVFVLCFPKGGDYTLVDPQDRSTGLPTRSYPTTDPVEAVRLYQEELYGPPKKR